MKTILRRIAAYTLVLFFITYIVPGFKVSGGIFTLLVGGVGLTLMFVVLKPILKIISFPINILTMGLSSVLTNALILYLLIIFVTGISLSPFIYKSYNFFGFITPRISFNLFFAYLYSSFVISVIDSVISWLID